MSIKERLKDRGWDSDIVASAGEQANYPKRSLSRKESHALSTISEQSSCCCLPRHKRWRRENCSDATSHSIVLVMCESQYNTVASIEKVDLWTLSSCWLILCERNQVFQQSARPLTRAFTEKFLQLKASAVETFLHNPRLGCSKY